MKIKLKLVIVFLVMSLLPLGVVTIYSTSTSTKALEESAKRFLSTKLNSFSLIVEKEVGGRTLSNFLKKVVLETLSEKASNETFFDTGYLMILDQDGKVIYSPIEEQGQDISEYQYVQRALEKKEGSYSFSFNGKKYESYLASNDDLGLLLWAIVPSKEVLASANQMKYTLLWIIGLAAVVITIVGFYFSSSISKPIKNLADEMTHISKNLDFTSITIHTLSDRKDEIGALVKSFLILTDNWVKVLEKVSVASESLLDSSVKLSEVAENSSANSEEISASVEEVANRATDQTSYLNQANNAIQQLVHNIQRSSQLGTEAFDLASTTLDTAKQGKQSITTTIDQMKSINQVIGQISLVVKKLENKSVQIGEIVNLIDSIANQTQLLALNAAIEAARAGEAGRGFSVVADEIKQLAEESMSSANQIKNLIKETQIESKRASNAVETGKREVGNGVNAVDEAGDLFMHITAASEKNLAGSEQTTKALEEAATLSQTIIDQVHEVAGIAEETSASAEEVSASTEEQTSTMQEVYSAASVLKNMALELQQEVKRFKIS